MPPKTYKHLPIPNRRNIAVDPLDRRDDGSNREAQRRHELDTAWRKANASAN